MLRDKHNKSLLLERNILRYSYITTRISFCFNQFNKKIVFNILEVSS